MPDDLLNEALSAAEDGSPANSAGRTPLVIDSDLRTIRVPKDYVFGVFNDKDVLSVPFVVPRFYDDVDLSTFVIRVNFTNKSGASSYYDVTESTVTSDTIEFYWLLGTAVFLRSGEVEFAVCLRKVEEDGLITKEFNTTLASATILPGLEIESPSDPAQYSILVQMRNLADEAQEAAEQAATFIGAPLKAETVSAMTDTNRIYVYVGDETGYTFGHWYYSDNGTWTDGGIYNAVASVVDATLTEEGMAADAKATGDAIQNGIYPDLYAGNLVSDRRKIDTTPYLFRPTANGASKVGDRKYLAVVGATVNVNQLVEDGNFESTSVWFASNASYTVENNIATVTPISQYGRITSNAIDFIGSHKYFMTVDVKCNYAINIRAYASSYFAITAINLNANEWKNFSGINTATTGRNGLIIQNNSAVIDGMVFNIKNVMLFDLTAMFGITIADYLYSLETATAGAGVVKLKELGFFTGEYIPYNPGSLESVQATAHKTVGFNQWDEECELGNISSSTGKNTSSSTNLRSIHYIPILPNTAYYAKTSATVNLRYYDANKGFIGSGSVQSGTRLFTTPQDACYLRFFLNTAYGTTYNHDICINLSSDRNGEYEPYSAHTYDLGTDTLRGLFKLDANNNLYADGDTKTSDGTVTRKYGIVDLGTLNWTGYSSSLNRCYASLPAIKYGAPLVIGVNIMPSSILTPISVSKFDSDTTVDKTICVNDSSAIIWCRLLKATSANDYKTTLSGVMLVYELATPTTEQSTPFTSPQVVDPNGTEEFITENDVPVGHKTEYLYDVKALAEGLIDVPDVPATNGTYTLKATRSASGITYSWVSG